MTARAVLELLETKSQTAKDRTAMATMVTGDELRKGVETGQLVQQGDPASVEGVKYDFHLSPHILKAKFKRPVDFNQLSEAEKREMEVEQGEVVFVLTQERLTLPLNYVAQLSPKRKLSHAGILTLGGLSIDAGYEGRLLIGLCNFSSTPFPLQPGKKLIAATFYRLSDSEGAGLTKPAESLDDFPEELILVMQRYKPVALEPLERAVTDLRSEVDVIRRDIRSHEDWYTRFKDSLEAHSQQIVELSEGLKAESVARGKGEDKLSESMKAIEGTFQRAIGGAKVIGVILAALLALLVAWLSNVLPHPGSSTPTPAPSTASAPAPVTPQSAPVAAPSAPSRHP
jgi:deoxycytidine triphosphate deaminase